MMVFQAIFWICAAMVVYSYAIYPLVIWVLSHGFGMKPAAPELPGEEQFPTVTLLIAAYNEESVIAERLVNALAADYPTGKMRIVVASDGSSDRTAAIATEFAGREVRVLDYQQRRGKASVLNAAMQEVDTELVLLSDANTQINTSAVRSLVRWFADPKVGVVCGRLVIIDPATGKNADGMYWKYETFLKKCEARLGALLGSNGAIYAIRRDLYVPIRPETIVDDFVIPLLARLSSKCRIVYDADAIAVEESAESLGAEFRRRSRIGAGGFQAITMLWRMLNPAWGWISFVFLSHKVLRWICPFCMIGMLLTSAALSSRLLIYWEILVLQLVFYAASALAGWLPGKGPLGKPLRLASMFSSMNLALLFGFWRWVRGTQKAAWERTVRVAAANSASPDRAEVGGP